MIYTQLHISQCGKEITPAHDNVQRFSLLRALIIACGHICSKCTTSMWMHHVQCNTVELSLKA